MAELIVVLVAFALLVGGVVGSATPNLPGAPFSIAGVLIYWWASGFSEPGPVVLTVLVVVGVLTLAVDWAGGVLTARLGGASTKTALISGLVGLILFVFTGPLGVLIGVAITVFTLEFYRQHDAQAGAKAALVTTAGMLGSAVAQIALTVSMLVAMVGVWLS